MKANDSVLLLPPGLRAEKIKQIEEFVDARAVVSSIGGSRLIGSLVVINNYGMVVSRMVSDEELELLKSTGLDVSPLDSQITAVGNLVVANDKGALASTYLPQSALKQISRLLGVKVRTMTVASYHQVGAVIAASNRGAVIHPNASEAEVSMVSEALGVDVEAATVSGGLPYVGSGLIVNSKHALVSSATTGPELMILSRALKI